MAAPSAAWPIPSDYLENEVAIRVLEDRFCKGQGLVLDTKMRFADEGRSAFQGRHRHADRLGDGGLADLLENPDAPFKPPVHPVVYASSESPVPVVRIPPRRAKPRSTR